MASLLTVRINKGDSPNLGFRLQGGKDFGTPLVIQKINGGSPAERAGLIAGDSVIKINNVDVFNLRHKDAQDVVVRAGPNFEVTVQRGGSTWKPSVVPVGSYAASTPSINHISPVTRTSLAATKGDNWGAVGTGHNVSAKPFGGQVNGAVNGGPQVVNKQYNSPIKLYSDASIAETLSAQTEVLSTGALGVNFKKNEKNYDASNSAVLRMLKEAENDPKTPDEEPDSGIVTAPNSGTAGLRHVEAPISRPAPSNPQLPPGQNICADCERLIVGVFVRIKDKNLHVECFKCATCGTSLKNVGYYNINNKLYCDVHAKPAALRHNPNPNLVPVTIQPGGKAPVHAISSALASHSFPTQSPLSPKINNTFASPYQQQETIENVDVPAPLPTLATSIVTETNNNSNSLYSNTTPLSFSKFLNKTSSNYSSAPKPFSSVSAPLSPHATLPRTAPLSPAAPAPVPHFNTPSYTTPSYSPASSAGRSVPNIVWPPPQEEPEIPTACPLFYPPPSQVEHRLHIRTAEQEADLESEYTAELEEINKFAEHIPNMSFEVLTERKSACECIETISETVETQQLVENILKTRTDLIPPVIPPIDADIQPSEPPKPNIKMEQHKNTEQETIIESACSVSLSNSECCQRRESCELKRPTQFIPNTIECDLPSRIQNSVPLKWESPFTQAVRTTSPEHDTFSSIPTKQSRGHLASALKIAPSEPFTPAVNPDIPVPLPEYTDPYMPPDRPVLPPNEEEEEEPVKPKPQKPEKPKSKFVKALETAPERPFTPEVRARATPIVKLKEKNPADEYLKDLPKSQEKLTMLAALTVAPERSYSPLVPEATQEQDKSQEKQKPNPNIDKSKLHKPTKPDVLPESFQMHKKELKPPGYYPPIMYEKTEETTSEEHTEETNTSKTTTIEKQTIHNPQITQIIVGGEEQHAQQNFAPLFHGFSCSFQNKTDHSQFSVEINTTPPVVSPAPKAPTPIINTIESQPGYIEKETITEEKRERQQTTKIQEQSKEEIKANITAKQQEDVIQVKATPQVALHKTEGLPSYQVQLAAEAESNLLFMEKKRKAEERLKQQKMEKQRVEQVNLQQHQSEQKFEQQVVLQNENVQRLTQESVQKVPESTTPIIRIEAEDNLQSQRGFRPVLDERPPSRTFSPRPGTITPSMINRPPSILPYYQVNLVPQHMSAISSNVFDRKSPAISRSPSPCPMAYRQELSSSPFQQSGGSVRAVSPAPGPPPNPLKSPSPLPTPEDSRVAVARENISTFIPEYKNKRDLIEKAQGMEFYKRSEENLQLQQESQPVQMYTSKVQTQNYPIQQQDVRYEKYSSAQQSVTAQQQTYEAKSLELQEAQKSQKYVSQTAEGTVSTAIDEQCKQAHLEQFKASQSVERSADGRTQVQRRKIVTEEFERSQKETNIQIEKNVTKKYPFREVNAPPIEAPPNMGLHFTNPQPISSPFLKNTNQITQQVQIQDQCQKQQTYQTCQQNCQIPQQPKPQQIPQQIPNASSVTASASSAPTKHVFAPSSIAPVKHVQPPSSSKKPNQNNVKPNVSQPDSGAGTGRQAGGISVAPRRGRGVLNTASLGGSRIPLCGSCNMQIRGPFITALGKIWCPSHFICSTPSCRRPLQDLGFVEERGQLYCEYCFEQYLAPPCSRCGSKIKGDCLKAIGKNFHPECFACSYCGKLFGNSPFFLEDGSPYCEADWNELFTTKCFACGFPVEAGDRWVEALNNNYHSQCFNCTMCKKNLEGQSFFAKGGRPFCKNHAR